MATLVKPKKAGSNWQVQINMQGVRESQSFATKAEATMWATQREAEILSGKTGKAPPSATLATILEKYLKDVTPKKRAAQDGSKWEENKIKYLCKDKIAKIAVPDLEPRHFAEWRDRRLKEVSEASVRREWTLLTHALKIAIKEWRWLDTNPMEDVKRPPPSEARKRVPTEREIEVLMANLEYKHDDLNVSVSSRVGASMMFAGQTAMRSGEIVGLKWVNVDLERRIARIPRGMNGRAKTKTGVARDIPLNGSAIHILKNMQMVEIGDSVFGLTASSRDTLFRRAKVKAGIEDLHFHDFRAYALTWMAKKVDVLTLAKISGHSDINELMTYYRETAEQIATRLD